VALRHDLSDKEWERLRVLLPSGPQQRGGWWADQRTVINGIFFRSRAGCPWRDVPEGFGELEDRLQPASPVVPGRALGADPGRAAGRVR
jgi:hypothetical protein